MSNLPRGILVHMPNTIRARGRLFVEIIMLVLFVALTAAVILSRSLTLADEWILSLLFAVRSPFLFSFFSSITVLGNAAVIIGISAIAGSWLILKRRYAFFASFGSAVAGAMLTEYILKLLIERARPAGFSELVPNTFSYPSGHATAALVLFGSLTYLLYLYFPKHRVLATIIGACIIAGVGLSRLYLGVHYPSDVLGGYLLATLWFFIGARVLHILQKRKTI